MDDFQSLEVLTAPVETKLIELQRLKDDLGLTQETDAFLNTVIDVASAEVSAYLNQGSDETMVTSIARQTVRETFFDVTGKYKLYLNRFPIGDITSVKENATLNERQITGTDGAVDIGVDATVFTSAAGPRTGGFISADAGQAIVIAGAGASGASHTTTIATVDSTTQVTLTDAALTTVTGASYTLDNANFLYKVNKGAGYLSKYLSYCVTPFLAGNVIVEYTCGWILPGQTGANLPEDIQGAVVLHCAYKLEQYRNGDSDMARIRSEEIEDVGRVEYAVTARDYAMGMSGEVRSVLDRYKVLR